MNSKKFVIGLMLGALLLMSAFVINAQEDNVLTIGLRDLVELDPALGAEDDTILFNHLQYDYLVEILPDNSFAPSLATDWTISDDGLTYTFNLRDDVTFHDGSAFTADDVVFSFNRLVEVGSSIVGLLGEFEVEAVDDTTVQFTLPQPNADFLFAVASRFAFILDSDAENVNQIAEEGDDPYANFNGTGPFILTDFNPGESATFVKNEDYWVPGQPLLDGVELVFFQDEQARVDALRSGSVDFIIRVPDDLLATLENADDITVVEVATNVHPVIRLRTSEGSLGEDVRVRQAFKHATDRELLNLDVLDGKGIVANNDPIGPVYGPLYTPQDTLEYDPQMACDLLAEVEADGADNGYIEMVDGQPRLEVDFNVIDFLTYPVLAEFVQQQWEDGCIYVNLSVLPGSVYYGEGDNNWFNSQLGLTNWGTRATPQEYLSVAYTTGAAFNESEWSNERLDELAAEAAVTTNIAERAELYDQIAQIFAEEGPIIIPYFVPISVAYNDAVQGIDVHPFPGRTDLRAVSFADGS